MKIKLLYLIFFVSVSSFAQQYTLIPDAYFEAELIRQGIDSGTPDGKVLTSKINTLTTLNVRGVGFIADLTGIQDFTALKSLFCDSNQLTSLDVSENTALTYLSFGSNYLTTIDVSKNTALTELRCYHNLLTVLDVSKNTSLTILHCYNNQLKNLDLSKNTALTYLDCSDNQLVSLNLKNGNNSKLSTNSAFDSNSLSCIQVDNVAYSTANWTAKDAEASYSLDCSAFVQYTLIPDVNFEKKLIYLGIDFGAVDGKVPTAKIAALTSLDVSSSSIANLAGIQDFTALQFLNCNGNQLTSLDVSKNIALTRLYCESNQLTSLNVSKNTALEQLTCYSNKLTALDVSNSLALTLLYCYSNQLTALDVSKNTALIELYCYSNQLASLNVSQNVSLTELRCHNNQLISFDVSKSSVLTKLYCYSNQLKTLDVSKNTALTDLYCYSNQLTDLDVSKNMGLRNIDCSSNQLTSLNLKNGRNEYLNTKNFKSNPDLGCIQADSDYYSNNTWKSYKDASASYSRDCSAYTVIPDVNFEKKLISLGIDFGTPDGKVLTSNVYWLNDLDVSSSSISDLTGIQDFRNLQTLHCENNQLTSLYIANSFALVELYCHQNQITALDVSKNAGLVYLVCYSNQLTALDVSKNIRLTKLDCYDNQLTALDVSKNTSLGTFYCYNNKLRSLNMQNGKNAWFVSTNNFTNNPDLTCIQVDNASYSTANWATAKDATASYSHSCPAVIEVNGEFENKLIALGIDTVKDGSVLLSSIKNVTSLDISNSGITSLSGIQYFSNLETLNCEGNLLTSIDVSSNTALKYLDCSKNPLSIVDVSKNTQLTELYCDGMVTTNKKINAKTSVSNQLTALDVSKNVWLTKLSCSNNLIVSLDLSQNTLLTDVNCSNNKLISLNLNNGKNSKLATVNFKTNASLSCIQVDDAAYANANWSTAKDALAIYSKTTCTLGIEDLIFDKIAIYPNPTKGELHIDNIVLEKANVYETSGKLVKTVKFANGSNTNSINLSGFPKGIYYVYLESEGYAVARKIIVE